VVNQLSSLNESKVAKWVFSEIVLG